MVSRSGQMVRGMSDSGSTIEQMGQELCIILTVMSILGSGWMIKQVEKGFTLMETEQNILESGNKTNNKDKGGNNGQMVKSTKVNTKVDAKMEKDY